MTGIVKRVVMNRNFGFIKSDISKLEYFFHREDFTGFWDDLARDIEDENIPIPVSFDAVESPKGPRAANVRRLDYPNGAA